MANAQSWEESFSSYWKTNHPNSEPSESERALYREGYSEGVREALAVDSDQVVIARSTLRSLMRVQKEAKKLANEAGPDVTFRDSLVSALMDYYTENPAPPLADDEI